MGSPLSRRTTDVVARLAPLVDFFTQSAFARRGDAPGACVFVAGDPQELALPGFVEALQRWVVPRSPQWYAYTLSQRSAQEAVAAGLRERLGLAFEPDDIVLTNGAFAGLAMVLALIADPGDEVIFNSPPWFFYEAMIAWGGAVPVRVRVRPDDFDLDLDAIGAALTPRTRAIIINTPNNPTGRIYPLETLQALAARLEDTSRRNGRTVYLISDEAYSRILYDGRRHHSPAQAYANTFVVYTYGKTLLTPGQRIGCVALPPAMSDRVALREMLLPVQHLMGYLYPNALLQHALPDLERLSVDLNRLQRRRDRMVGALRAMGYSLHVPEATFYLLPRSPVPDDQAFAERLARDDVFVLPGTVVEMPGYFRISLTANDDMVERALPVFAAALAESQPSPAAPPRPASSVDAC
jgi:aspartate aminotransferase